MMMNSLFEKYAKMQELRVLTTQKLGVVTEEIKADGILQADDVATVSRILGDLYKIQEDIISDLQNICGGERDGALKFLQAFSDKSDRSEFKEFIRFLSITSDIPAYRAAMEDFQATVLSSDEYIGGGAKENILALINKAVDSGDELMAIKQELRDKLFAIGQMTIYTGLLDREYRFKEKATIIEENDDPDEKSTDGADNLDTEVCEEGDPASNTVETPVIPNDIQTEQQPRGWQYAKPLKIKKMVGDFLQKGSSGWRIDYSGREHLNSLVLMLNMGVVTEPTVNRMIGEAEKNWLYTHGYISQLDILQDKMRVLCISVPGCAILNHNIIREKGRIPLLQEVKPLAISAEEDHVLRALAASEAMNVFLSMRDLKEVSVEVDIDRQCLCLCFEQNGRDRLLYFPMTGEDDFEIPESVNEQSEKAVIRSELVADDRGVPEAVKMISDKGHEFTVGFGEDAEGIDGFLCECFEINENAARFDEEEYIERQTDAEEPEIVEGKTEADPERSTCDDVAVKDEGEFSEENEDSKKETDMDMQTETEADPVDTRSDKVDPASSPIQQEQEVQAAEQEQEEQPELPVCERDAESIECICEHLTDGDPTRDERDLYLLALKLIAEGREYEAQLLLGCLALESEGYDCLFKHLRYIIGNSIWGSESISAYSDLQGMTFPEALSKIPYVEQSVRLADRLVYLTFFAKNDFEVKNHRYISAEGIVSEELGNACKSLLQILERLDIPSGGYTESDIVAVTDAQKKFREFQASATDLLSREYRGIFSNSKLQNHFFHNKTLKPALEAVKNNDGGKYGEVLKSMELFDDLDICLDEEKLEAYIDDIWAQERKGLDHDGEPLVGEARKQMKKYFTDRIELINQWLDLTRSRNDSDNAKNKCRNQIVVAAQAVLDVQCDDLSAYIIKLAAARIVRFVSGKRADDPKQIVSVLAGNEFVMDDAADIADISEFKGVRGLEPWRHAIRQIIYNSNKKEVSLRELYAMLSNGDEEHLFANETSRKLACRLLGNEYKSTLEHAQLKKIAEKTGAKCKSRIEKEYLYGRIDDADKEDVYEAHRSLVLYYIDKYEELGKYIKFCELLERHVDRLVEEKSVRFSLLFEELKNKYPDAPILDAISLNITDKNFVVAEEYMSRLQSGIDKLDEAELSHTDYDVEVERFLAMYDDICKNAIDGMKRASSFSSWARTEYKKHRSSTATASDDEEAKQYYAAWDRVNDVNGLLSQIGFTVTGSYKTIFGYTVSVTPPAKNRSSFSHPIGAFGTSCREISVFIFKSGNEADSVVEAVEKLNPRGKATIVVFYAALTKAQREDILTKFKKDTSKVNSFLLLDYTLGFYLSLISKGNRLNAFLKCTVPYTGYKLYSDDTDVLPEMFINRNEKDVQRKITDMGDGTTLVYGGRRLGKTQLFKRACAIENDIQNGKYALWINVERADGDGENFFVDKLANELLRVKLIPETDEKSKKIVYRSNKDICDKLRERIAKSDIKSLYLFVDEVNDYFEMLNREKNTSALVPFNELRKKMSTKFKYVFAGLHHVARYSRLGDNNSVIGQMSMPLVVGPLTPLEARRLIEYPFSYLGIKIEPQLIALLASRANYYPGNIQMICQRIVETILIDNTLKPPYTVDETLLEKVCGASDINKEIKQKLMYTLKLDKYKAIAYLFTYFHYRDGYKSEGYDEYAIHREIKKLDIACMKDMDVNEIKALLDELTEMSILRQVRSKGYKLRKMSFAELIEPNKEAVDEYLLSLAEDDRPV